MLEGIPKKEYPRLFYRYFKEFLEVLAGKTSLKFYLAYNYLSFYKPKFKEKGEAEVERHRIYISICLRIHL